MFRVLLKKELRQLLPWCALVLIIELGFTALQLAFTPPDELVWAFNTPIFSSGLALWRSAMLLLWALLLGNTAFAREHDERTFDFLFNLPVPRARLFTAKLVAGAGLLSAVVLLGELLRWLLQLPNSSSFEGHTFRLDWALISAGCSLALAWIATGYGLFLSLFRRMGLLIAVLAATLLEWLEKLRPNLRLLNPLELLHLEFHGSRALIPWLAYAGHLLTATMLAALAGFFWVGRTEYLTARLSRTLTSAAAKWLFVIGLLAAVLLVGELFADSERSPSFGSLPELDAPEARLQTARYDFRYPEPLAERVKALAKDADALHARLSQRFAIVNGNDKIQVNLLKRSATHAGSATWNAIRMDLAAAYDLENLNHTLAHETAHVLALRASDRRMESHANTLRFFDEGLAEQLAFWFQPNPSAEQGLWLEAVLTRSRSRIDFTTLVDFAAFTERFSERSLYALGFTWLDAATTVCNADAAARILKVLAQPDTPRHLSGEALMQHVLQGARCDLGQVIAQWAQRLDAWTARLAAEVQSVPFVVGALKRDDDADLVMHAELRGPALEGASYRMNVRATSETILEDQVSVASERSPDGTLKFYVPEGYTAGGVLHYQFEIAWLREGAPVTYDDEWRKTALPD